jgi:hypothetical protein
MSEHPADRRRFKRIAFDARTELSQGQHIWPVKLIDLSSRAADRAAGAVAGDKEQDFSSTFI